MIEITNLEEKEGEEEGLGSYRSSFKSSIGDLINAMNGLVTPQMMKVLGNIRGSRQKVYFLVYSRSTHNFLSVEVTEQMGVKPDREGGFQVVTTNEGKLRSYGLCRFRVAFHLSSLEGTEAILNVTWLYTLGLIP